ncbi:MAG: TatD family hydrolase, partial [Myxococcales bacterium]|nr:TatD family hydrolase [Myxococcales bacterium]
EARAQAMARARAAGVEHVVVPGVSPEEWRELELMRSLDGVDVAVGIHPEWLGKLTDAEVSDGLARLATEAKRLGAVAIGEFGMDGPAEKAGVPYDRQRAVLDAHLEVARALELPVILHVFRCQGVALDALKRHGPLRAGGVVHSYSGSAELVPQYVGLNLHLSFAGAVTRPNAERPIKALRAVPPERLLVETDSPDQLPDGVDAERTEPAHVRVVAEAVARHLGETADVVAARTTTNAVRLFRLAR